MDDGEIAEITKSDIYFFDFDKNPIKKDSEHFLFDSRSTSKNGFEHFMLKEMYQQPGVIEDFLLNNSQIDEFAISDDELEKFNKMTGLECSKFDVGMRIGIALLILQFIENKEPALLNKI